MLLSFREEKNEQTKKEPNPKPTKHQPALKKEKGLIPTSSCLPLHHPFATGTELPVLREVVKLDDLQVKQFGRPMGKSDMQTVGLKLLFSSCLYMLSISSNISSSGSVMFKVKDGGTIIKEVV